FQAAEEFEQVQALAIQQDSKVLVAQTRQAGSKLRRFNTDGTLDTTFANYDPAADGPISSFLVQPDGKIIVVGNFNTFNSVKKIGTVRLNADGTIDPTWLGQVDAYNVTAVVPQPDGRILVAGDGFYVDNNVGRNSIARLNADGTLDPSFDSGD